MPFTDTVLFVPSTINPGTYPLTYNASDTNGCVGRDSVNVTFTTSPLVELDSLGPFCNTSSIFLLENGSPLGGIYTLDGIQDSLFDPLTLGVGWHQLEYNFTDSNGCSESFMQFVEVYRCVGLEELGPEALHVYPNPSSGKYRLEFEDPAASLLIRNHLGQIVRKITSLDSGYLLDLSSASKGIYFLELTFSSGQHIQKSISLN